VLWTVVLLVKNRYAVVHAHEEAVFFCAVLKPLFGYKLIYDMHSCLPQQLINFKFTTSKLLIGLFEFLENQSLRIADAVITICPDLEDYVLGFIEDKSKHIMIENSIFEPVKILEHASTPHTGPSYACYAQLIQRCAAEKKLIVYAGSLEPYQGIDILLEAFKYVVIEEPDTKLMIVGGLPQQVCDYQAQARKIGVDASVCFTGQVPQRIAQKLCRAAAVQISPRSRGTNTPLKIYEQLAIGIPLVATNIYSHTQTIDAGVAFLVDPEPQSMAQGILEALQPHGRRVSVVQAAQALYENKYSRAAYETKLRRLFNMLGLCAE
jgi:glycosyltransferase involved in cell wall biosynthesis